MRLWYYVLKINFTLLSIGLILKFKPYGTVNTHLDKLLCENCNMVIELEYINQQWIFGYLCSIFKAFYWNFNDSNLIGSAVSISTIKCAVSI